MTTFVMLQQTVTNLLIKSLPAKTRIQIVQKDKNLGKNYAHDMLYYGNHLKS